MKKNTGLKPLEETILGTESPHDVIFSKSDVDLLIYTPFRVVDNWPFHNTRQNGLNRGGISLDPNHEYAVNSFGYRGPEFKDPKFVFAGCSQTFGLGVSEEAIWGVQMANKNNQEYVNVSIPGVSTQWIVQKLFAYFREYGNPEVIACLFPDLYRMSIPLRRGEFHAEHNRHSSIANIQMGSNGLKLDKPKYSKVPHIAEDVIPAEVPLYFSFQYITMLEQYCNSNGIKLVWSSWDFVLNEIVEKYQQHGLFKNYVSIDNNRWFSQPAKDILYQNSSNKGSSHDQFAPQETCHEEYRELYDGYFDKGSDIELGAGSRHMGAHRHMHIAEAFLSALEKQ